MALLRLGPLPIVVEPAAPDGGRPLLPIPALVVENGAKTASRPTDAVASLWHRLPAQLRVVVRPLPGGLHHEYRLEEKAA